jgi:hypothetical protein
MKEPPLNNEADLARVAEKLIADIARAQKKLASTDQRRATFSLDARIGDADAKREMAKLNDARNALLTEIGDLDAALVEVRRRMGAARQTAALEAEAERARQAAPIVERLAARGAQMDSELQAFREHHAAIQADLNALARLGVPTPSRDLVAVNLNRALDAATMGLDSSRRPVPPLQRHSFTSLLHGYDLPAQRWVETKLNANNPAKAA